MKKIIKFFGIVFLILISLIFVYADITVIDSFNRSDRSLSGDTADNGNAWTASGSTVPSIVTNRAKIADTGTDASAYLTITEINSINLGNVTQKFNASTTSGVTEISLMNGANDVAHLYFGSGNIYAFDGDGTGYVLLQTYSVATVYNVEIVNINFTSETFDVVIGSTLYDNSGTHFTFKTASQTKIDTYDILGRNSVNYVLIDDINFVYTAAADSCTAPAINNDWEITISDGCTISADVDLGTGKLIVSGDAGTLTVSANVKAAEVHYKPTDFDGDFIIKTTTGGQISAIK